MSIPITLFIIGIIIISYGGNKLVDGAIKVTKATGISEIIMGATVVSLGTVLPEILVSSMAAFKGSSDIALGNVVGSLLFNTAIIGSICILFMNNKKVDNKNLNWRVLYLIAGIMLLYFLAVDGMISKFDGLLLLVGLASYFWLSIILVKTKKLTGSKEKIAIKEFINIIIGAILLYLGSNLLVDNAIILARNLEISERIIGLTIVSIGSSLPELTTTIVSIIKKHYHVGLGNIIGANILNIFVVCGFASFINEIFVDRSILKLDIPLTLGVVLFFVTFPLLKAKTYKLQGIILITSYILYCVYLFNLL